MSNSNVTAALAQGTLIAGKYRLLRTLGEGSMGVVWSARNEITSGQVALKLILGPGPELRLRLLREAQVCCQIQHKNVIQIHDVGQTSSGDPFLVMELLSGETLANLLGRKRRLNQGEAAAIARDIARALSAAHDKGIVHRDLKPANIFLHNQPGEDVRVVKVLDFGVSKNLLRTDGLHTMVGGPIGSPSYMSPEQARSDGDIDARADIWSLGVLLFEMLTGERPFLGEAQEVIERITRAEIPVASRRVRSIDPGLDRLIAGCLTRDREQRLWPIVEVVRGLEPFIADAQRAQSPTITARWGLSPASSAPPPSGPRLAPLLPPGDAESDAETQKLEAETLSIFAVGDRAPRAILPDVPSSPGVYDPTVKMFSASPPLPPVFPPPLPSVLPLPLPSVLSAPPPSVRPPPLPVDIVSAPGAMSTTARTMAVTSEDSSPALRPASWAGATPHLGEAPPPKESDLRIVRAFVGCVVAAVVLLLAFTHSSSRSAEVAPEAPAAVAEATPTIVEPTPTPPVDPPIAAPVRADSPQASAAASPPKPPAAPLKSERGATPPARVVAPKPPGKCGRFVKSGCVSATSQP